MMKEPFFSIVIATRNRAALLDNTLAALVAQQWPRDRFEILVADNGSTDKTRAIVTAAALWPVAPRVHYRFVATPGKSHPVHAVLRDLRRDVIAVTHDDVGPA